MTTPKRVFIGWDSPVLERAARWLIEHHDTDGTIDLGDTLVLVPAARAGRWLEGYLIDLASEMRRLLIPPRVVPLARAIDELVSPSIAPPGVRIGAWHEALRQHPGVAVSLASAGDRWSWAHALQRSADALAGQGLTFADAANASSAADDDDRVRLAACAELEQTYRAALTAWDAADVLMRTAAQSEARVEHAVLVAPPELGALARKTISAAATRLTTLVAAPEALEARFDAWGVPAPAEWINADLPLLTEHIRFARDPDDQAQCAWECVASLEAQPSARELSIGVLDAASASAVARVGDRHRVRTRDASGRTIRLTAVGALLNRVAEFLRDETAVHLGELLRHPDIERSLAGTLRLDTVDGYFARTSLARLPTDPRRWPAPTAREGEGVIESAQHVRSLLGALLEEGPAPLTDHIESLMRFLGSVYDIRAFDASTPSGRTYVRALESVASSIEALRGVRTPCTAAETVALLVALVAERAVPPEPDERAVELLGWLELATDPAPVCVLCDASEGRLPSRAGLDPLLPPHMAERLGLPGDASRAGRDAYLLALMSSSKRALRVVSCASTSEGDPLSPSRLLFRASDGEVLGRLERATSDARDPLRTTRLAEVPDQGHSVNGFGAMPTIERADRAEPETWPVTSFRRYLASPYAFYVSNVLRRREQRESAGELDPAAFGDLLHEALRRFGEDDQARHLLDETEIASAMGAFLHDAANSAHGSDPPTSVWLQVEQGLMRLRFFAKAQALWAQSGWRIERVEWSPEGGATFEVPGGHPITLTGKIDRLDRNLETGAHAIIDYKTGKDAKTPDKSHRVKGEWRDLQLPLYRHLTASLGIEEHPTLAYALLPPDEQKTQMEIARWTPEDLNEADACARSVVQRVRAGEEFGLGDRPVKRGVLGALSGFGLIDAGGAAEDAS